LLGVRANGLRDDLLGGHEISGRQVHQRELRPAPRGVLRVRRAGVDRLAHEPRGAPRVARDEQQVGGPAVSRDIRPQIKHPLIVLGGEIVLAQLQRRVAEQAVGGRARGSSSSAFFAVSVDFSNSCRAL
jgi:hypothetical protein